MEENGANVIKVAIQGEETASCLIRPNLDLVIVTAGYEEGLGFMEVNPTNWAIVFLESIDQSSHTIVPELYGR